MRYDRNRRRDDEAHEVGWLTTFNDMITLMMVFFVLIFSMSSLDQNKIGKFVDSLQSALGVLEEGEMVPLGVLPEQPVDVPDARSTVKDAERAVGEVEGALKHLDRDMGIEAVFSGRTATITLDESLLFGLGSADVNPKGRQVLKAIAAALDPMRMPIRVEGHTDDIPVRSGRYASNWELSTARAVNVLTYLQKAGIAPERLSAVGYGASRPAAPNDSPRNRMKNRRVEIVMVTHGSV